MIDEAMIDQEINRIALEAAEIMENINAYKERIKDYQSQIKGIEEVKELKKQIKDAKAESKDMVEVLEKLNARLIELKNQKGE